MHTFSGQASGPIESSGASVMFIIPRQRILRRFSVPAANPTQGDVWRVMDLVVDASGQVTVVPLNTFATSSLGYDP